MQLCGEQISAPSLSATAMRKEELSMRVPTAEHRMASRKAPANGAAAAVRRAKPVWVSDIFVLIIIIVSISILFFKA